MPLYIIAALLMIVLDQVVKYWAFTSLQAQHTIPLIENVFHLTYVENRGAAFSLFSQFDSRWIFVVLAVVITIAILIALSKNWIQTSLGRWSLVLVIAGALGNAIAVSYTHLDVYKRQTFSGDETDLSVRKKYQCMAAEQGNEAVHACLAKVDPEGAGRLHPNNLKRVIRALEVYEQTGMTIDAFNRLHKRPAPKYAALKIGICPAERQTLYDRIDRRVDQMLADGLLAETQRLLDSGMLTGTAAQAIGYKELLGCLQGSQPLQGCVALLKQRSRNYAKRQLTWLKRDDNIHWIYYNNGEDLSAILQKATEYLQNHGVQ